MTIVLACLLMYAACVLFVRTRNATTLGLTRQLTDFSTFMVPFNIPAYLLSRVPNTPFVDQRCYPELKVLEDNWEVIRDEALALYENGYVGVSEALPASNFYRDGRWTSFYLKLYDCDIPSAYQLAPRTMALIDQVPSMNIALFACLNPGKKINKHHDPFAYTLRYSLGLSTPNSDDCGIVINGQDYKWKDGEGIIFDETYLHNAYNNTDKPRIILMTDIDRPLRSKLVQGVYFYFGRFFNSLFAVDNVDSNITGIGNKLGKALLGYRAFLKRFKRANKPLYVASKVVVIGGLLALLAQKLAF